MSDQQQFQSADKDCILEIVNTRTYSRSLIQNEKIAKQYNHQWKFQKIKRPLPHSLSPRKIQTKNISFQTQDLDELSDSEKQSQDQEKMSAFSLRYQKSQQVYKKKNVIGTRWLGNKQYFASVFIDPSIIAKSDIFGLLKPKIKPTIPQKKCWFDSSIQSGNLFAAYQINENQYDLILQNDTNSKGNTQWFYFQLRNVPAKTKLKMNIVNMMKSDSLFNYGMQPCVFSATQQRLTGNGWSRSGSSIKYFRNDNRLDGGRRFYYTLTFTITNPYQGDDIKIAQCYPYTVNDLNVYIQKIQRRVGKKSTLKRETAGLTIGKNNVQVLRIQQENPRKKGPRPIIFVTARQHPGQTPGSFVCEGFVEFVLSDEKQAVFLRKNYEIIVLPMLNPDGTTAGNYRTNLCGLDLNRRWDGSKPKLAQQSVFVKKYISEVSRNREVAFIIDLHGHSRKLFSFFYGNSGAANPYDVRIYPYICAKSSENKIRFEDSTFVCEQAKRRTARIQLWSKLKIPNIFTFQVSFFGYINKKKQKIHFTIQGFKELGKMLGKSIFVHQRAKANQDSVEGLLVKKYYEQLKNKPSLIAMGQKACSGSQSQPEKGQIMELEYDKLEQSLQFSKQLSAKQDKKGNKRFSKKQILIKQVNKASRQLHVMDIARVNSMFPNDILALMPSSFNNKFKERQRTHSRKKVSLHVQTDEVPFIKIYDICKNQQKQKDTKNTTIKNTSEIVTQNNKLNIFRATTRPKSSSNSYLDANINYPSVGKRQIRKRHDSGIQGIAKNQSVKRKSIGIQTYMTFAPDADFIGKSFDCLMVNPISRGIQAIKKKSNYSTISSPISPENEIPKRSNQSFKIGLKALNVQTWRIKKKNFQ